MILMYLRLRRKAAERNWAYINQMPQQNRFKDLNMLEVLL